MSDIAQRIDIDSFPGLLVSQWDQAPRLRALAQGLLEAIHGELVDSLDAIERGTRIDTAEGVWLDRIGERLALSRPSVRRTDIEFFGFDGGDGVGFDQGPFATTIPALVPRVPIGDAFYRCLLRLRSLALLADGSAADLERTLRSEFPQAQVVDNGDMTITVQGISDDRRRNLLPLVHSVVDRLKPAGVALTIEELDD